MGSVFCLIDDKHVPMYRIMWLSDVPHFCGQEDCQCEGDYEVRLDQDESLWANRQQRDQLLAEMENWYRSNDNQDSWE